MTTDTWLAIAHHLAVFGLLAVLAIFPAIPVFAALMARGIGG